MLPNAATPPHTHGTSPLSAGHPGAAAVPAARARGPALCAKKRFPGTAVVFFPGHTHTDTQSERFNLSFPTQAAGGPVALTVTGADCVAMSTTSADIPRRTGRRAARKVPPPEPAPEVREETIIIGVDDVEALASSFGTVSQSPVGDGGDGGGRTQSPTKRKWACTSGALGHGKGSKKASTGSKRPREGEERPNQKVSLQEPEPQKKAPKRALTAYTCFVADRRPKVMLKNPGSTFQDIATIVGKMWRNCNTLGRAPYQKLADADKHRYQLEKDVLAKGGIIASAMKRKKPSQKGGKKSLNAGTPEQPPPGSAPSSKGTGTGLAAGAGAGTTQKKKKKKTRISRQKSAFKDAQFAAEAQHDSGVESVPDVQSQEVATVPAESQTDIFAYETQYLYMSPEEFAAAIQIQPPFRQCPPPPRQLPSIPESGAALSFVDLMSMDLELFGDYMGGGFKV